MESFLKDVDGTPPQRLASITKLLTVAGFADESTLVGVTEPDIEQVTGFAELALPERAFVRRAVRQANAAANALVQSKQLALQTKTSVSQQLVSLPVPPTADVTETVGAEFSASSLAKMLATGNTDVDVAALIKAANMGTVSFHMQCEMEVYKVLGAENTAAENNQEDSI